MPAILRRFWAYVLVVIRHAERPVAPSRIEPPSRAPLLDDRFGYGFDLGPGTKVDPPSSPVSLEAEPEPEAIELEPEPEAIEPEPEFASAIIEPDAPDISETSPIEIPPPQPQYRLGRPSDKWVKPKGEETVLKRQPPAEPRPPSKPRAPRPQVRPDSDEDQWGQYYFRDAILDQLDRYFFYLKRMRRGDVDSYALLRKIGIQVMPPNAIRAFDKWRGEGEEEMLSAWFRDNLPSFGAISYGIDPISEATDQVRYVDAPPELMPDETELPPLPGYRHQIGTMSGGGPRVTLRDGSVEIAGMLWSPKFLYFRKYKKNRQPPTIQRVKDGVIYTMTIYWDRLEHHTRKFKKMKGGIPQEYAIHVREDGSVGVLRMQIAKMIRPYGKRGGVSIPQKIWGWPTEYLNWAHDRDGLSPESYLCRCFIEAALMYETAALGSLIRVEVRKDNLTAAFGVEIKRTSYFFKDRDVVLNASGGRAPIFHVVRPHARTTKSGTTDVKMHFRGLREFEWAGYRIGITVPGLDHLPLPEFNVGSMDESFFKHGDRRVLNSGQIGDRLRDVIKDGVGAWKPNGRSASPN
jgi:hypothetical protein